MVSRRFRRPLVKVFNTLSGVLIVVLSFPVTLVAPIATVYADAPSVQFSEVAWMGSATSDDDEWIELKNNTGESVDLLGWAIEAGDETPYFQIATSTCSNTVIGPNGYFLLERSNDDSAPSVSADCIYTGALENRGENLGLYFDGNSVDVIYAEEGNGGWPAGDNDTDETMQLCGDSWTTAIGTPKAGCSENDPEEQTEEVDQNTQQGPICGNKYVEEGEQCDDGNYADGDGCSANCSLETLSCEEAEEGSGWYGEYFNYSEEHPDMALPNNEWPDDGHGDPLSASNTWDTDWYDGEYLRFSRVDSDLDFGDDFFPFDIAPEETNHNGHDFHFGAHWRALVTTSDPGDYEVKIKSDDDSWVYVDGVLVGGIPGVHAEESQTFEITLTGSNVIDIFFAERHTVESHFSFKFRDEPEDLSITPLPPDCGGSIRVCKFEDQTGNGPTQEDDTIYPGGWGMGLIDKREPTLPIIETELVQLHLVGGEPRHTDQNGCVLFEDLYPGKYVIGEERKSGWVPTGVKEGEQALSSDSFFDIFTDLSSENLPQGLDSFFDVFVEIDLESGEQKEVSFYNYNIAYCGDEAVNQEWEQCDGGEGCTEQCQLEEQNQCSDLVLAKVSINEEELFNVGAGNVAPYVYLGSSLNQLPNGTWFPLFWNGSYFTDPDIAGYEDVSGLAVERREGSVRTVLHGGHGVDDREHTHGTVMLWNAVVTDIASDPSSDLPPNNSLENPFDGVKITQPRHDEIATTTDPSLMEYWMTVNTADDGFFVDWQITEDCKQEGLCVVKFEDLDVDGEYDEGEPTLSGWVFKLFGQEEYEEYQEEYNGEYEDEPISEIETSTGGACFDDIPEGDYVVQETSKEGWTNTTGLEQEVSFGGTTTVLYFGNARNGEIHGIKYFDANKNGVRDEGELGLPNWEIELYQSPNGPYEETPNNAPLATTLTCGDIVPCMEGVEVGSYWFTDLPPGVYQVFEVLKDGWEQTEPALSTDGGNHVAHEGGYVLPDNNPGRIYPLAWPFDLPGLDPDTNEGRWALTKIELNPTFLSILGRSLDCVANHYDEVGECGLTYADLRNVRYYSILLESGGDIPNADFGNWIEPSKIHGVKFYDRNADHEWDEEEPGLSGWEIQLFRWPNAPWKESPLNTPVATTTTCGDDVPCMGEMPEGSYWFTDLPPDVYQVYEVRRDGWTQTAPWGETPFLPGIHLTVLPDELVSGPQDSIDQNVLDWWRTTLERNPTMWQLVGNSTDCVANHHDNPEDCIDSSVLLNLLYYSILLKPGSEIPEVYFGNFDHILTIGGEKNGEPEENEITVFWETNVPATSRVVYGTSSVAALGDAPNYGYPFSTGVDPLLVTNHVVVLTGLVSGETYYWRPISSASPEVIGNELSFTTSTGGENGGGGGGGGGTTVLTSGGGGGGGIPTLFGGTGGTEGGSPTLPSLTQAALAPLVTLAEPITGASTGVGEAGPFPDGVGGGVLVTETAEQKVINEESVATSSNQVAGLLVLGFLYQCNWWTTILALLVLLSGALYLHMRHKKTNEAIIGLVLGALALFFVGVQSCTWLLVLLALIVLLLLGWDIRRRDGSSENV